MSEYFGHGDIEGLADFFQEPCQRGILTDRKFNRMRPSMARVLGLETRSTQAV
jgi:hypothetical protein